MTEAWLPVPGYVGLYEVSDRGRVRSLPRQGTGGGIKAQSVEKRTGYRSLHLYRGNQHWRVRVHVIVALAFHGPRPADKPHVRHVDGDTSNNTPSNLAYGTPVENAEDTIRHGHHRQVQKDRCPSGHRYTPENTTHYRGHRRCRECKRRYDAARRGSRASSPSS